MLLLIIIIISTIICYSAYFKKEISPKIPIKRKKQLFELLQNHFRTLKENDLGYFEYKNDNNKRILIEYTAIRSKNGYINNVTVFLDITDIEDDIKKLCKIHFYCRNIEKKDYVTMRVDVLFDTLSNLAKYSNGTVDKIISDTESYISQKRAERDKKQPIKY